MGKVILKMHLSLDGFVGPADGSMDWIQEHYDDELREWEDELLGSAGVHVMGRRLYEEMAAQKPQPEALIKAPKLVFSRTLEEVDGDLTEIAQDPPGVALSRLKEESEKDILVHGGPTLVESLFRMGLVDQFLALVHPVVLGGGMPMLKKPHELKPGESRVFPGGAMLMRYH